MRALLMVLIVSLIPLTGLAGDVNGVPDIARLQNYAAYRSSSTNPDPRSNDDSLRPIPGETVVLADLQGPGVVNHIWLTVAAAEYGWPRLLRLRIYYENSPVPSVDVPVGDFFAVGHGLEQPVSSLVVRASSSGRSRNCYWPMPFKEACRITITNEGSKRVSNLYFHVDWRQVEKLPKDFAYFHARYRQELPALPGQPYSVLEALGRGHLVGAVLSVIQSEPGWFGEGDESIFVDGSPVPSIVGTGTEDYFNDAWSLRVDSGPYSGVTVAEGTGLGSRMTAYRWHLHDPVPFRSSLRFVFEHNGWTFNDDGSVRSASGERADLFSSVAFWYQQGVSLDQPQPPYGSARLPHGNAKQLEIEDVVEELSTVDGTVEVMPELFWGKDVVLFGAEGIGAKLDVPFEVTTAGRYEISVEAAHSFDYGEYSTLLDGRPTVAPAIDHEPGATVLGNRIRAYHHETYVGAVHVIGWFELEAGSHILSFVCDGRHPDSSGFHLGIDNLVLARTGPDAWPEDGGWQPESQVLRTLLEVPEYSLQVQLHGLVSATRSDNPDIRRTAFEIITARGLEEAVPISILAQGLADPDPIVRGLAAIAIRNLGENAAPALANLTSALGDSDENVRIMAADALAAMGPIAAPAVPALIEACRNPNEIVHAQRSLASALGAIGPAAQPALPVLRDLAKIPRVSWPAEAAIEQILDAENAQILDADAADSRVSLDPTSDGT